MLHNVSGQLLRAARAPNHLIAENCFYWWRTSSEQEAAYLVGLLNADSLQPLYRAARKSDRHFHQHIWREVPIPKFDPDDPHHVEMSVLCGRAEQVAEEVAAGIQAGGQLKMSKLIRVAIRYSGIGAA